MRYTSPTNVLLGATNVCLFGETLDVIRPGIATTRGSIDKGLRSSITMNTPRSYPSSAHPTRRTRDCTSRHKVHDNSRSGVLPSRFQPIRTYPGRDTASRSRVLPVRSFLACRLQRRRLPSAMTLSSPCRLSIRRNQSNPPPSQPRAVKVMCRPWRSLDATGQRERPAS